MAKDEFVGIIGSLKVLQTKMVAAPKEIARECLMATYNEVPRPPWNTGQLRSSGSAYVGGRRVAITPLTGPNPNGPWQKRKKVSKVIKGISFVGAEGGKTRGSATSVIHQPWTLNITKFQQPDVDTNLHMASKLPTTVTGEITIIYHSPVAALMHEWEGGFSDPSSGKFYITAKFPRFEHIFTDVMRRIW